MLRHCLLAFTALVFTAAAQARSFEGVVTHVTDGDTLWVRPASGGAPLQVRLQGIDAPEICQAFGEQARKALSSRVLSQRVTVNTRATDSYQRMLARVTLAREDLGGWMVRHGNAWSDSYRGRAGRYVHEQTQARQARLGLWAQAAEEPRAFRKRHGSCKATAP